MGGNVFASHDSVKVRSIQVGDAKGKVDAEHKFSSSLPVDVMVYLVIGMLVLSAWKFSRMDYFKAGDDAGYWIGVAGGVMMLLLFSYPLRKYFTFARSWGRVKWWFLLHMMLGVGGPVLILLHSTFRVGSLNAAVALYSMVVVALSGVIGRFIFARVNRGLHGEKMELRELQSRAGLEENEARSKLAFAPRVEARLLAFEQRELKARSGWMTYTRQVFWLPVQQWLAYRHCARDLRDALRPLAQQQHWGPGELLKHERYSKTLVRRYLRAVTLVAQYTAYARFFSLWHVAHIPFVYLMVVSAVVHVVAVHAY
ncbi:hypothetical protein [Rhodoferax sp.]|uniref:hypothetical protein n=1 Tax=Rhodoferax sp. TaxID=50421 RepID=UPI00262B87DB|nr:hypothetical protein [Rhodoferax sp.]MDD2918179.1 hypothetical protein [Rhodoferax sp.]